MRHYNDAMLVPRQPSGGSGLGRASREQLVIETLEEGLSQLSGHRTRVRPIRATEIDKSTSFAIHRVDVQLESGDVLPVVFKDLNPLRQFPNARHVRRLELGRSRREMWMYRDVLPGLGLGTPRLYGYRWEPRQGNLWLFLEDVGPQHITAARVAGGTACLALFERAAAWAARFHAATAEMSSDERLLRCDRAHYERRGRQLEAYLDRIATEDRPLVMRTLDRYATLVQLVGDLPHGMIHGEYFSKNVLVRREQAADAIAVIDWETAATGPQYVDLVSISAGNWTRDERMAMRRAYFDARHSPLAVGADWRRFNEEVDIVAILQAVNWLSFWLGNTSHTRYTSHASRWMRELRTTMSGDVPA